MSAWALVARDAGRGRGEAAVDPLRFEPLRLRTGFHEVSRGRRPLDAAAPRDVAIAAFLPRPSVGDLIQVGAVDHVDLLREREAGGSRVAPLQVADHRAVVAAIEAVEPSSLLVLVELRSAGDDAHAKRLRRCWIERHLALRIGEAEAAIDRRIHAPENPVDVALAGGRQPRATRASTERPFPDRRRRGSADQRAHVQPIAGAIARAQVEPRAEMRAEDLRIGAGEERRVLEDVAVDQRQRSGILDAANGMKQQTAVHVVDAEADVVRSEAAHRELRAIVVAGGDAGKDLDRTKRIVGNDAAEREQLATAEDRLTRRAGLPLTKPVGRDRHVLHVGAGALGHGNRHVGRLPRDNSDGAPNEPEADHGHDERLRSRGDVGDDELAVEVRHGALPGRFDLNEHGGERRRGAGFDDLSLHHRRWPAPPIARRPPAHTARWSRESTPQSRRLPPRVDVIDTCCP